MTVSANINGYGCINGNWITDLVIPGRIGANNYFSSVSDDAFVGDTQIKSVELEEGVKQIGSRAFKDCSKLESITLPESLTYIFSEAFSGCTSLKEAAIPSKIKYITNNMFTGCTSLTSVSLPNGLTNIYDNAFKDCANLTSINLPESVTSLGQHVFDGCSNLKSLTIPRSIIAIGFTPGGSSSENSFEGCSILTVSVYPGSYGLQHARDYNISYKIIGGVFSDATIATEAITQNLYYTGDEIKPEPAVSIQISDTEQVVLQKGTDYIYQYQNNTEAGEYATVIIKGVNGYSGSVSVEFEIQPADISTGTIKIETTEYNYTGEAIEPAATVTVNGKTLVAGVDYTLSYSNNTEAGNAAAITATGKNNYQGTLRTTFTIVPGELRYYLNDEQTQWLVYNEYGYIIGYGCADDNWITDLVIPAKIGEMDVLYINENCFSDDTHLQTVVIPEGIELIWDGAFKGCTALKRVELPENVDLSEEVFSNCTSLTEVVLKDMYEIPANTFSGCTSLKSINIPFRTSIGDGAFNGCSEVVVSVYAGSEAMTYVRENSIGYTIIDGEFTDSRISWSGVEDKDYTGSPITLDISVRMYNDRGSLFSLTEGIDYEVSYANNQDAGNATVYVTGKNGYSGTVFRYFRIDPVSIPSSGLIIEKYEYMYTGEAIKPQEWVYVGGKALTRGTDYELYYSSNVEVGTATVTVKGKNNYTGQQSVTFEITEPRYYLNSDKTKWLSYDYNGVITGCGYTGKPIILPV